MPDETRNTVRLNKSVIQSVNEFIIEVNLLTTKFYLLYIRNQSVPRCKHFPSRL